MSNFLSDTFAGTGAIAGHAPETVYGGLTWSGTAVNLAGGLAVSAVTTPPDSYASTSIGSSGTNYSNPETFWLTFTFRTGADVAQVAYGIQLTFTAGTTLYNFELQSLNGTEWEYRFGSAYSSYGEVLGTLTLAQILADTEYTVVMAMAPDVDPTITLFGLAPQTVSSTTFSTGDGGLRNIVMDVGATFAMAALAGSDTAPVLGVSSADLFCPPPTLAFFGGATAQLTGPSATLSASASKDNILVAPPATGSAYGGATARPTAPVQTLSADGHDSYGERSAILTAPTQTISAFGGATAGLVTPRQNVLATGTVTILGSSESEAPLALLVASGRVSGAGAAMLRSPLATLTGYSGAVISISVHGSPTLEAHGTTGSVGFATIVAPLFELAMDGSAQRHGSAILEAPSAYLATGAVAWLIAPGATLTAIGHAVVAVTYEAYAVNLIHKGVKEPVDEVTRYTNFPFERIVRYNNSYFGVAADGLYLLEGTTDHATPATQIPWEFKTHMTDFENPKEKTIVSAYFGGRLGKAETITLYAGEKAEKAYKYKTSRGSTAQNHREKFGRGIKARYFAIGANGADGMELDNIEFNIHSLTRRI